MLRYPGKKLYIQKNSVFMENDKERVTEAEIRKLILDLKLPVAVLDLFNETCNDEVMECGYLRMGKNNDYSIECKD